MESSQDVRSDNNPASSWAPPDEARVAFDATSTSPRLQDAILTGSTTRASVYLAAEALDQDDFIDLEEEPFYLSGMSSNQPEPSPNPELLLNAASAFLANRPKSNSTPRPTSNNQEPSNGDSPQDSPSPKSNRAAQLRNVIAILNRHCPLPIEFAFGKYTLLIEAYIRGSPSSNSNDNDHDYEEEEQDEELVLRLQYDGMLHEKPPKTPYPTNPNSKVHVANPLQRFWPDACIFGTFKEPADREVAPPAKYLLREWLTQRVKRGKAELVDDFIPCLPESIKAQLLRNLPGPLLWPERERLAASIQNRGITLPLPPEFDFKDPPKRAPGAEKISRKRKRNTTKPARPRVTAKTTAAAAATMMVLKTEPIISPQRPLNQQEPPVASIEVKQEEHGDDDEVYSISSSRKKSRWTVAFTPQKHGENEPKLMTTAMPEFKNAIRTSTVINQELLPASVRGAVGLRAQGRLLEVVASPLPIDLIGGISPDSADSALLFSLLRLLVEVDGVRYRSFSEICFALCGTDSVQGLQIWDCVDIFGTAPGSNPCWTSLGSWLTVRVRAGQEVLDLRNEVFFPCLESISDPNTTEEPDCLKFLARAATTLGR